MLIRTIVGAAALAAGTAIPVLSAALSEIQGGARSYVALEDDQGRENPILELDAERSYKSEALLSHKSAIAAYGKVVGIRTTAERAFTPVQTWADIEEFVLRASEDRLIVRILEPWGTELVRGVTVNRKSYPASIVRPVEPPARDPFEKVSESPKAPELSPASPSSGIPHGAPKLERGSDRSGSFEDGPRTIEPLFQTGAMTGSQFAHEAAILSLALFTPAKASQPLKHRVSGVRVSAWNEPFLRIGVFQPIVEARTFRDENGWLQDCIDLADRQGLLSAKPIVTADRRQRAFAIYTLYMALKDLRTQTDSYAAILNTHLSGLASKGLVAEVEHASLVRIARSYEESMSLILKWDAEAMKSVVRGYSAELQVMDSARSMLAFLSKVKKQPLLSAEFRALVGGSAAQN